MTKIEAMTFTVERPLTNGSDPRTYPNGRWPATAADSCGAGSEGTFEDARRILSAAAAILKQGEELLGALSSEAYTQRVTLAFNASIGGHYRHCVDHFVSLLRGLDSDTVDYDHRERDARVESQLDFALALTCRIRGQLERMPPGALEAPVRARCEVSYAHGESPVSGSTFGREMAYAIAHAIHHYALISIMARLMEVKLPEQFGVAPSTVAFQAKQARR